MLKSAVDPSHGSCEILGIIIQLRAHSVYMDGSSVAAFDFTDMFDDPDFAVPSSANSVEW